DRLSQISGVDLVVVDEAHHAAAPSYKTVLQGLGSWEGTRTVGFTATMSRSDDLGLGDVWEDVVFHKDIMWGIINGFLVDVERSEERRVGKEGEPQVQQARCKKE